VDTGRFAVADVVALANKFLRDVSISTDFAIPGGACLPPLVYAIAHICTGVRNTCRASPKFRILVKRALEFRISGNPVFTCNRYLVWDHIHNASTYPGSSSKTSMPSWRLSR
jgi:hypothetical protein